MPRREGETEPTDADLAREIGGSAPGRANEAEGELYRRFFPRARLFGLRHLGDEHAAADLAQEALLLTLERLRGGGLREPEKIASFVLGTCRTMVLDRRRNAARRERLLEDARQEPGPGAANAPEPEIDADRLRGCLDLLPERERTVVVLSFYADRTAGDLGRELGLSPGNVRVIRHRAIARLRDCLAAAEGPW